MPQASDELRNKMAELFGDPISDSGPTAYLEKRGYTLHRDWQWSRPNTTYEDMKPDEYACLLFLVQEWDFGGLTEDGEQG